MVFALLGGLLVLLIVGLVVAVATAVQARRELDDLEHEFAEHRGVAIDHEDTPPWSSFDLEDLRDDPTEVAGHDPYATLTNSEVSWNASSSNEPEPEPNGPEPEPNGSGPKETAHWGVTADLAPIEDLRPVAWRPTVDAPVIVLVVGAGFLGTGMTANATRGERLRRAWSKINDSFAETGVITLEPDAGPAAQPYDDGPARGDVDAVDARSWSRPERRRVDPFPPPEEYRREWQPRSNRFGPEPTDDPDRIVWRAPPHRR